MYSQEQIDTLLNKNIPNLNFPTPITIKSSELMCHNTEKPIYISTNEANTLIHNLQKGIQFNAYNLASQVITTSHTGDLIRLIVNILLNHRYKRGIRKTHNPTRIRKIVAQQVDRNLPIQLIISTLPFKTPNLLKARGPHPDLAEFAAIARLSEPTVAEYQTSLQSIINLLEVQKYIHLQDYRSAIIHQLTPQLTKQKNQLTDQIRHTIFKELGKTYQEYQSNKVVCKHLSPTTVKYFTKLFKSFLYCLNCRPISKSDDADTLTRRVYNEIFATSYDQTINDIRQNIVADAWPATIDYVVEIISEQALQLIEQTVPNNISCETNANPSRLTLCPISRATKLHPFDSTGYINAKGKISANYQISLQSNNYRPVYCQFPDLNYQTQPFCYLPENFTEGNKVKYASWQQVSMS
jgi:hypothetical protein